MSRQRVGSDFDVVESKAVDALTPFTFGQRPAVVNEVPVSENVPVSE